MSSILPVDRLLESLRVEVPGATDDLIRLKLFNVIDNFCRATNAWKYEESINLAENTLDYPFAIPPGSSVVRLMGVSHNGVPMSMTQGTAGVTFSSLGTIIPEQTFGDGDAIFDPAVTDDPGSGSFTFAIYRPNYLSIDTNPDASQRQFPLKVVLALTVDEEGLALEQPDWGLPDWMYKTYFDDLWNGAMAALCAMPAKPWTSAPLATLYGKRFRNNKAFRKQEALRGFAYNVPTWRFPAGWGGARR